MPTLRRLSREEVQTEFERASADGRPFSVRWIHGRRSAVAVVAALRRGGLIACVPAGFLSDVDLGSPAADDARGVFGPSLQFEFRILDSTGTCGVCEGVLVDLSDAVLLEFVTAGVLGPQVIQFVADGRAGLPSIEDLGLGVELLVSEGGQPGLGDRLEQYQGGEVEGADFASAGVPEDSQGAPSALPGPLPTVPRSSAGPSVRGPEMRAIMEQLDSLRQEVRGIRASQELGQDPPDELPDPSAGFGAADPQFFAEGKRLGISADALRALLDAAGAPPKKLADPSAARLGPQSRGALGSQTPRGPATGSSRDPRPSPMPSEPPIPPGPDSPSLVEALSRQNELLIRMLGQKRNEEPNLTSLLGGPGDLLDDAKVSGARGCAARVALAEQMRARPAAVVNSVRKNLARALDKPLERLDPGDMRQYMIREVPFGNYVCLTYFGFLLAHIWEQAEEVGALAQNADLPADLSRKIDELRMSVALGNVFTEQVATEGGAKYQLGWLLTNLQEPPFGTTTQHRPRPGTAPHGRLVEAQWVAAQLAYLRDLDLMNERIRKQAPPHGPQGDGGGGKDKGAGK